MNILKITERFVIYYFFKCIVMVGFATKID